MTCASPCSRVNSGAVRVAEDGGNPKHKRHLQMQFVHQEEDETFTAALQCVEGGLNIWGDFILNNQEV